MELCVVEIFSISSFDPARLQGLEARSQLAPVYFLVGIGESTKFPGVFGFVVGRPFSSPLSICVLVLPSSNKKLSTRSVIRFPLEFDVSGGATRGVAGLKHTTVAFVELDDRWSEASTFASSSSLAGPSPLRLLGDFLKYSWRSVTTLAGTCMDTMPWCGI